VGGLVGGLVALLLYGFQALLLPMSMGMGDAKLAPSLFTVAGFLGYGPWRNTLLAISIVGALASLSLLLAKRLKGRKAKFAYGPSMVVGAVIALLV
jgi:leader peptidase (prepilin peptidase)/N-methyltransferase